VVLSFFSWTVIVTKARQLYLATTLTRKFLAAYNATSLPLEFAAHRRCLWPCAGLSRLSRAANEVERL